MQLLLGCQTTSKYKQGQFEEEVPELKVYGMLDREFSSEYFGSFRFVFENKVDEWLTINNISLSFPDQNAQKYIRVLDENDLAKWGRAIRSQAVMDVSTVKELQSAIINAGSSVTGMVEDISKTIGIEDGEKNKDYPQNHLYAEDFVLPSGFAMEKWVLLNSANHSEIPYITDVSLTMDIENKTRKAKIKFRNDPGRYEHFIWYDPVRDFYMNFYLGVSVGMAIPMGDFKEVVNASNNLLNSFGVNGYLSLLKHLGVNFSLDYEKFPARGILPIPFDSLDATGVKFEFYNWEIFSFLASPRFVYPVTEDAELFAELSLGVAMSRTTQVIIKRAGVEVREIEAATDFSFMGGIGAGSRFYLSDKMNLDLKLEYFPLPKSTYTIEDQNNIEYTTTQKLSQVRIKVTANWDI
jgi:opacity protein-like surface antigen